MKILWFTWKDMKNPSAGGAEVLNEGIAENLVTEGHEVIFLVSGFKGGAREEIVAGYKIIRLGNKWTVYLVAFLYYIKNLRKWADVVIDEINTVPFFCGFYAKEKSVLIVCQLARKVWFYEMFFPLSIIGYVVEPIYLWLLRKSKVVTISESTRRDLVKYGFKAKNISVISIESGLNIDPVENIESIKKYKQPTILSLGAIRPMKRTDHVVKAFELAKEKIPDLLLIVAGEGNSVFGKKVLKKIVNSKYAGSIKYVGKTNDTKKRELMRKSHIICVTSAKEGWGLVATEANSQGTPAIVYDIDGLRDSVRHDETGVVCEENTPKNMAENIVCVLQKNGKYEKMRKNAWEWSKEIKDRNSAKELIDIIK